MRDASLSLEVSPTAPVEPVAGEVQVERDLEGLLVIAPDIPLGTGERSAVDPLVDRVVGTVHSRHTSSRYESEKREHRPGCPHRTRSYSVGIVAWENLVFDHRLGNIGSKVAIR